MVRKNFLIIFMILISLLFFKCSSEKPTVIESKTNQYDTISVKYFNDSIFNPVESNGFSYLGFGQVIKFRQGPGARAFEVIFEKILFNSFDSALVIKGYLKDVFNNDSINHIQIVQARLNDDKIYQYDPEYIEYYNYLISEDGKFDAELKIVNGRSKIIFGERPNYDENGKYNGTIINSMYVYDVFKLLK